MEVNMRMYRGDISVGGVYAIEIDFNVEAEYDIEENNEVTLASLAIYKNGKDVTNFMGIDLYNKVLDKTLDRICLG
jgi:hypothetical protein